eukprot:1347898-Amorphochlora_amoeboformis.AAC.2
MRRGYKVPIAKSYFDLIVETICSDSAKACLTVAPASSSTWELGQAWDVGGSHTKPSSDRATLM